MSPDGELLRRYAEGRDEAAFAEIVRRHAGLVYGAALRQVGGDPHRAQEVAQAVFCDLARKAGELAGREVLASWLYASTRLAAGKLWRTELRRSKHEREAEAMKAVVPDNEGAAVHWEQLRPVIDEVVQDLGERDREAVLQRFFANRAFAEIGATLGVSEDAARMRVERALEKLRDLLARRGITSTGAALGAALTGQAMAATPGALVVTSLTSAALAGAAAGPASISVVGFMASIKLQLSVAGVLIAAGVVAVGLQAQANTNLKAEVAALQVSVAAQPDLRAQVAQLGGRAAETERLRQEDVEFARLRDEIAVVKARQAQAAAAAFKARAEREAELRAMPVFAESQLQQRPKAQWTNFARGGPQQPWRNSGKRAEAVISYVVDADGYVRDVQLLNADSPAWGDYVVTSVRAWRFEAGRKDGKAVNTQMRMPVIYSEEEAAKQHLPPVKPGDATWPWF